MSQPKTDTPEWMAGEQRVAAEVATSGRTRNVQAPQLVRVTRAPSRKQKAFYIQDTHSDAFESLAYLEKKGGGKKAPELAEEAIELLLEKYGVDLNSKLQIT